MKEFIEFLIKSIVTKPGEVQVTEVKEEDTLVYSIKVSSEDMGIVIGKEGHTIKSIRNLAKSKAIKDEIRVAVVIEENAQN